MLLAEMDDVSRFGRTFLQVPNLEIFILIYDEELTDTCGKVCAINRAGC